MAKELTAEELETLADVMAKTKMLEGITLELCGSWLWAGGNTKENRDGLKALGYRYAPKKKLWYYHTGTYFRKGRKHISKEEIDEKYGCQRI